MNTAADMRAKRQKFHSNTRHAANVLDALKTTIGCADCGFNSWPESLHFDHVDPQTKRTEPGWARDRTKLTTHARLEAYLDHVRQFCVIRCANCHARRSKLEGHHLMRREPLVGTE